MIRPCTSEYLLASPTGLDLRQTWFPRVVAEAFLKSTKDGEIKRAPDPVTMIEGDLTWYNESPDRQALAVQVIRSPRSVIAQSPSTVVIHDSWTFDLGRNPSAVEPTVTQDAFGGKCQIDRDSVAPKDLLFGRVFYECDATQAWVNIGLVEPGQAMHFRYRAAVQTPGVWTAADSDSFQPRWEAEALWTRLVAFATPWSVDSNEIPEYPTNVRAFFPAGNYTYFAPDSFDTGDEIDVILLGGGGGGEGDGPLNPSAGGLAAAWVTETLVYGTDYDSETRFDIVVGRGGSGGTWGSAGSPGGATTITWTDPSDTPRSLSSAGGLGGVLSPGPIGGGGDPVDDPKIDWGQSPGDKTFHSRTYVGGAMSQPNLFRNPGNAPGGGGAGGGWLQFGCDGADGAAWINARGG